MSFVVDNEPIIRFVAFFSIFAAMALFEIRLPRRETTHYNGKPLKEQRWLSHGLLVVVNSVTLRLIFPLAAVGTAIYAADHGIGLFNGIAMPWYIGAVVAFFALDFAVWLEHWASHKVPLLWRIHRMHHADTDLDVTTALRFHPMEILLSMIWKAAVVVALGAPVLAVLLFEIVLNGMAMFNHANVKLPLWLDRWMRLVFVTPDMHRVHHSLHQPETDSNYGFNFSFWDRLFNTYTAQPKDGHEKMLIGLEYYRDDKPSKIGWSLSLPFRHLPKKDV